MTAEPDNDPSRELMAVHVPARRGGSILLVLLVAGGIVAAAVALMTLGRTQAQPYIVGLLALLAMVGLFNLFAFAAGMIRFADRAADDPVMGRIADHAFDGLAVTDPRGHVVYFNAAYLALTGAASALEVRPVERVFIGNPDVSEAVFRLLKAAREGKRQQEEVRIAGQDGAQGRWLRMRVRPLGQGKRETKYAVWSIADITRDRERQEDVFQELQHAIEYLDHAPCGFFSVNPAGEIVYINATLANWLDYDLAEIGSGGLKLSEIVSGDGAALLTSIVPMPGEVKTEVFDIDLRMRGGKTMPVRLYHKLAFGADGAPGASRTLVISRARDERADPQRAAEVRFMRFFDHTPMAIATVDRAGGVLRANARYAKLAQDLSPDGAAGSSIFRAVSERDRKQLIAAINQAAKGQGDIPPVEVLLDGARERWGQFFVTAVEEDERETEAAIVYMLETTARRTLENQINQSQKMDMVGQLAGGIAHDFNNFLSVIRGYARFLIEGMDDEEPLRSDAMEIENAAERASRLTRQLLVFSRNEVVQRRVVDIAEVLSGITSLLARTVGEDVAFQTDVERPLRRVEADPTQIEQVLVNLVVNARDAMPSGGELRIELANVAEGSDGAPAVRLTVRDTGAGMSRDVVEHAFEPFYSTKPKGAGTGLGLATVYGIVTQSGGTIEIDSTPGAGTTIEVLLPATEAEAAGEATSYDGADGAASGETILVVEDEAAVRRLTCRILTREGYTVLEAPDGPGALDTWNEHAGAIDLLLTDVVMPGMSGKELAERLGIEPVFMSGYTDDVMSRHGMDGVRLVQKPFDAQTLLGAVRSALSA
ncbi:MAG: ATP-binding protein [Xanthobacteraceae bacterium]